MASDSDTEEGYCAKRWLPGWTTAMEKLLARIEDEFAGELEFVFPCEPATPYSHKSNGPGFMPADWVVGGIEANYKKLMRDKLTYMPVTPCYIGFNFMESTTILKNTMDVARANGFGLATNDYYWNTVLPADVSFLQQTSYPHIAASLPYAPTQLTIDYQINNSTKAAGALAPKQVSVSFPLRAGQSEAKADMADLLGKIRDVWAPVTKLL